MWLPDDPQAPSRLYCRSPRGPRDAPRTVWQTRPVPGWAPCWPSRALLCCWFSLLFAPGHERAAACGYRQDPRRVVRQATNCLRAVAYVVRAVTLTDGRPQAQDSTVSGVTRLRAGRKDFGLVGGSDGGREEGEAWEETERSMLESSRVPTVPILKVVDGLPLPTAYCGGGGVERGSWPVRSRCACKPNFCARRKEARRQGSKEVGYCLIRQFERRKAG